MNDKLILRAAAVLTVLLIFLMGVKTTLCCQIVSGKMVCYCAERGWDCLCPVVSCPQCASHDDFEEEDWSKDILFQFPQINTCLLSFYNSPKRMNKPGPVYLPAPEKPPRISDPS